ncbi:peptide ABC transporter permease [Candidatus Heimdallarchaeota archaeon B3_Heim]|nr:MAG: peptide ABC transporter permease [Candidatus Heimdallarchaeota archaeon B3_Heim]
MKLRDYAIKRLLLLIPVMFGVSIMSFILSNSIGDPIASYIGEDQDRLTEARIQLLTEQLGLDQPLHIQYIRYLQRLWPLETPELTNIGSWYLRPPDLGVSASFRPPLPVLDVIITRFPATAELAIFSMIFAVVIGIPLGIVSATRKDQLPDQISRITALSGVSMPIFWLGLMLQVLIFNSNMIFEDLGLGIKMPYHERYNVNKFFAKEDNILGAVVGLLNLLPFLDLGPIPTTGFYLIDNLLYLPAGVPALESILVSLELFIDALIHIFPPAFCLAWVQMALITRMTRMAMIETMRQDFILLAKSKGLSERVIIYRHALKNALIPTLTIAGLSLAGLLTGTVLTETVFDWPGIGRWAVTAVSNLDIAAIQGFVMVTALIYVLSNLLVDILYAFVDPRIRYD